MYFVNFFVELELLLFSVMLGSICFWEIGFGGDFILR